MHLKSREKISAHPSWKMENEYACKSQRNRIVSILWNEATKTKDEQISSRKIRIKDTRSHTAHTEHKIFVPRIRSNVCEIWWVLAPPSTLLFVIKITSVWWLGKKAIRCISVCVWVRNECGYNINGCYTCSLYLPLPTLLRHSKRVP